MTFLDPSTGFQVNAIKDVSYTHDALIDIIVGRPEIAQGELARMFGYSDAWVSIVVNSDAFKGRLAERKAELTDPLIIKSMEERLRAVGDISLQKLIEKLDKPAHLLEDKFVLDSVALSTKALGYGAKPAGGGSVINGVSVVVNLPGVAASSAEWAAKHARPTLGIVEDARPVAASTEVDHENAQIAVRR